MLKKIQLNDEVLNVQIVERTENTVSFIFNEKLYQYSLNSKMNSDISFQKDGEKTHLYFDGTFGSINGVNYKMEKFTPKRKSKKSQLGGELVSPMPGKVLKVNVKEGQNVKKGEVLLILEAMKMEHSIKATNDGVISKVFFNESDLVDGGVELLSIDEIIENELG